MKISTIFIVIVAGALVFTFVLGSCASKSKALKEETQPVQEEKAAVKEKPAKKEETKAVEEPDISVTKKVEELAIAKEAPSPVDSDGDGVYDNMDKCPGTPKGVKVDRNGCPEKIKELTTYEFVIEFDLDSTLIRDIYNKNVREAIDFMKAHPEAELVRVIIEGHADSSGPDTYNYNLSHRRAVSVKQFLIRELNIDPEIIQTRAFGERNPIASNNTKAGRQRNRRALITFSILSFSD
jgi:OOP family OmpA-OmpF porin